jgi:hypothetical protein
MSKWKIPVATMLLAGGSPMSGAMAADPFENLKYAFSGGVPNLELRARVERAEQDNNLKDADAYTLRARLGYTTGKWNDIDLSGEYEGTFAYGPGLYNSGPGGNGRTDRVIIADPEGTQLNQSFVRYSGLSGTVFKLGRQRLTLDNARFIGNCGWRQNESTLDAISVVNTSLPKTTLSYAYVTRFNSVFYAGRYKLNGQLLNAAWAPTPLFNLTGYGYLLDFDLETVAARRDTQTLGLRASGAVPVSSFKFVYAAEYATQSDYKEAPATVDADYYLLEAGAAFDTVTAKLGYEVLGGDGVYGFQTPLATLHAFQGWADLFLNTPNTGIRDAYLSVGGKLADVSLLAVYHDFDPDSGSGGGYGSEIDLQASKPINSNFSVLVKYADYNADSFAIDTRKTWLQVEYKF